MGDRTRYEQEWHGVVLLYVLRSMYSCVREIEKQLSARLAAELIAAEAKHNSGDWKSTLERVVPAIVSLKLNSPKVRV